MVTKKELSNSKHLFYMWLSISNAETGAFISSHGPVKYLFRWLKKFTLSSLDNDLFCSFSLNGAFSSLFICISEIRCFDELGWDG